MIFLSLALVSSSTTAQIGPANTPPMGFNTYVPLALDTLFSLLLFLFTKKTKPSPPSPPPPSPLPSYFSPSPPSPPSPSPPSTLLFFFRWNLYHCAVDATILTETATAMVKTGLKDAGYIFVNSGEDGLYLLYTNSIIERKKMQTNLEANLTPTQPRRRLLDVF